MHPAFLQTAFGFNLLADNFATCTGTYTLAFPRFVDRGARRRAQRGWTKMRYIRIPASLYTIVEYVGAPVCWNRLGANMGELRDNEAKPFMPEQQSAISHARVEEKLAAITYNTNSGLDLRIFRDAPCVTGLSDVFK